MVRVLEILVLACCAAFELAFWLLWLRGRRRRRRKAVKCLYSVVEERVLSRTIQERIDTQQATSEEFQKLFLYVEFPDTKPLLIHVFSLDECVTIGRSQENRICIRDDMLSRLHCKISLWNGELVLQDLGAANGTQIRRGLFRRVKLGSGQQEFLRSGDQVRIGNYRIRVRTLHGWEAA